MERGKKRQHWVLLKLSESIKDINYTEAHCTSSGYKRFKHEALFSLFQRNVKVIFWITEKLLKYHRKRFTAVETDKLFQEYRLLK